MVRILLGEKRLAMSFRVTMAQKREKKNPSRERFELRKVFLFLKGWG